MGEQLRALAWPAPLHRYTEERLAKLNRFLRLCGLLTLALNTAGALWHLQFGTAAVDVIGPVLLIDQMRFGNLDFIKVGRRRLITREHLERFLDIDPMAAPTQGSAG